MRFAGKIDINALSPLYGEVIQLDKVQMLGSVNLFYRDELGDQLGIRHNNLKYHSDAELVLLAYKKWRDEMFQYICGEWSFVLYDLEKNSALLSRDTSENSSLFYLIQNGTLHFSNDVNYFDNTSLFHLEIDRVELIRLSLRLVGSTKSKTIISGLSYVPPDEYIFYNSEKKFSKVVYPKKDILPLRYKKEHDYFLQFKSLLADAVICRLQDAKKPGIFLSSGLDSTTVCSFLLKSSGLEKILHTYTSIPKYVDESDRVDTVSEQSLVEYFLQGYSNVKSSFLQFPQAVFGSQFDQDNRLNLFNPIFHSNSFWLKGILEKARQDGVDRLFTGQMGNYSISFRGDAPSVSLSMSRSLRYLFSKFFADYFFKKQQWKYSVIRDDLISKLSKTKSFKAEFKLGYQYCMYISKFRKKSFKKIHCFASTHWSILAQEFGIRVVDPTSDLRLVSFLEAIPSALFYRNGIQKYLLKQSMLGILPGRILFNRIPKPQSADIGRRLADENFLSEIVQNLVDKYKNSDFFDVDKLKAIHMQLANSRNRQLQHVLSFHLLYMISIINCYDRLQSRQPPREARVGSA